MMAIRGKIKLENPQGVWYDPDEVKKTCSLEISDSVFPSAENATSIVIPLLSRQLIAEMIATLQEALEWLNDAELR